MKCYLLGRQAFFYLCFVVSWKRSQPHASCTQRLFLRHLSPVSDSLTLSLCLFIPQFPVVIVSWCTTMSDDLGSYVCSLDAEREEQARRELNENSKERVAAMRSFREWILQQKNWLKCPTGEIYTSHYYKLTDHADSLAKVIKHTDALKCRTGLMNIPN